MQIPIDYGIIFKLIGEIFWSFALIVIYCEFGERLSAAFDDLNDVTCQLQWYKFPVEIRRTLRIAIGGVQQPVDIRGFGNISCGRKQCKKVGLKWLSMNAECML